MNETSNCGEDIAPVLSPGIKHIGTIMQLHENHAQIQLLGQSGCGHCAAKSGCSTAKNIREFTVPRQKIMVLGQEVELYLEGRKDLQATFLLLGIPVLLMIGGFFVASYLGLGDVISALIALGSMGIWYGIVRIFRTSLENRFAYKVSPLNIAVQNEKDTHE